MIQRNKESKKDDPQYELRELKKKMQNNKYLH
jgi:hypothetical protein